MPEWVLVIYFCRVKPIFPLPFSLGKQLPNRANQFRLAKNAANGLLSSRCRDFQVQTSAFRDDPAFSRDCGERLRSI